MQPEALSLARAAADLRQDLLGGGGNGEAIKELVVGGGVMAKRTLRCGAAGGGEVVDSWSGSSIEPTIRERRRGCSGPPGDRQMAGDEDMGWEAEAGGGAWAVGGGWEAQLLGSDWTGGSTTKRSNQN